MLPQWSGAKVFCTTRDGGTSQAPYNSFNLGDHVGDDPQAVFNNRQLLAFQLHQRAVFMRQVHGNVVAQLHHDTPDGQQADACFTLKIGVACTIMVADCLPILFYSPSKKVVAAAHAGWRGLAAGVLEATLDAVCATSGCQPQAVEAWLGPCIGPRQFEVGDDVRQAFVGHQSDAELRFAPLGAGKWLAHLPLLATDRLRQRGVKSISGGNWCTVEDASRFFSFRRDRITGRMVAAIWLVG